MTTNPIDIAEGRRLLAEATPGPWRSPTPGAIHHSDSTAYADMGSWRLGGMKSALNAELTVWARNSLPALLDLLERALAVNDERYDTILELRDRAERYRAEARYQRFRADKAEAANARHSAGLKTLTDRLVNLAEDWARSGNKSRVRCALTLSRVLNGTDQ